MIEGFKELLIALADILERLKIPYCITGGLAVSVWGRPRGTFDVDVVVQLGIARIKPLAENLRKLSEAGYIEETIAKEAVKRGKEFNFFHPETGIKIDFWVARPGDTITNLELQRRIPKTLDDCTVYFISPEDLVVSKLRWYKESGSTRQLEDIESVLRIQKNLDVPYIRTWAAKQGTLEMFEQILSTETKFPLANEGEV